MIEALPPDADVAKTVALLHGGDRAVLARAITLIESRKPEHQTAARALLHDLLPHTGGAIRVGISGVPGVGKSTLIDALGSMLTQGGHKLAVLTVDPSSVRTGGSVLGDKTRMHRLAGDPNAFIRPSPSSGTLGGVAARTGETLLLCEAAGFDVVIIETVGVGQSETAVADLVDFFLVLMLPGAGDELQGIKKGIVEIADMIAVNKADGNALATARAAVADYSAALRVLTPTSAIWTPPVIAVSGATGAGLEDLWAQIEDHHVRMTAAGEIERRRQSQRVKWLRALLEERLAARLHQDPVLRARLAEFEQDVGAGRIEPQAAVDDIAALMGIV